MTDHGPSNIGKLETHEKKLEPTTGSSANFPDVNTPKEVNFADVLLARGVE